MTRIQRGVTRKVRHTRGEAETGGCGRGVSRHLRLVKRISLGPGKNNIVRAVFTQVLLLAVIRQPVGCTDYVEQSGNHVITRHHQVVISYPRILKEDI